MEVFLLGVIACSCIWYLFFFFMLMGYLDDISSQLEDINKTLNKELHTISQILQEQLEQNQQYTKKIGDTNDCSSSFKGESMLDMPF